MSPMSTKPLTVEPLEKELNGAIDVLLLTAVEGNSALNAAVKVVLPNIPPPAELRSIALTSVALLPLICTSPVVRLMSNSMPSLATAGEAVPVNVPAVLKVEWLTTVALLADGVTTPLVVRPKLDSSNDSEVKSTRPVGL